ALPSHVPPAGRHPRAKSLLSLRPERLEPVVRVPVGNDQLVDTRKPGLDVGSGHIRVGEMPYGVEEPPGLAGRLEASSAPGDLEQADRRQAPGEALPRGR